MTRLNKEPFEKSATCNVDLEASTPPTADANEYEADLQPLEEEVPRALAIPNKFCGSERPRQETAFIC